MKRTNVLTLLLLAFSLIPGCIEEKNEFIINPDGSGKVRHHVLFSPMQMKLGRKQTSKQEQLKQAVKKEIAKSRGVDAWKNVSYKVKDDGTLSFTGTAYFSDISEVDFHSEGVDGPIDTVSMSENPDGTVTFSLTSEEQDPRQPQENTNVDLTEEEIQKKIEKARQKFKQKKSKLSEEDIQISHIYNLPAPVESSTNVKWDSPKRGGVFISGKELVTAMETMIANDELMRERVKQGKGLEEPPSNMETFNEMVFGEKGPVQFTISGEGRPQFHYEQEVQQAQEETKQLKSNLGIETTVASAGENDTTAGSGSKPDGQVVGVARLNQKTLKLNWGIALLNTKKNVLYLGLYPKMPNKSHIQTIKENRQYPIVPDLKKPFIQIDLELNEGTSPLEDAVKKYSVYFWNFTRREDTAEGFGFSAGKEGESQPKPDGTLKLDGSLKKGKRVKGISKGSKPPESEWAYDYSWKLKFDLPIQ